MSSGILREGARRVWRRQRVLWWFFAVNLVLAFLAATPLLSHLSAALDHSLTSQRLVNGFDVGTFSELASNPDVAFGSRTNESTVAIFVFFVFALFLTGGILAAYSADYKLSTSEFFQACGAFFWRWVRLLIFMVIVLVPIAFLSFKLFSWAGTLINEAAGEKTGYWVGLAVTLLTLFLLMTVRLWFDMGQVRAVLEDERAMRRTFVRSFKLTFSNFGSLFWLYFRISFLAWLGLVVGLWLWARIPGQRFSLSFGALELVLLWWVGTRLWQRASETIWYQRRALVVAPSAPSLQPVTIPEPAPAPLNTFPTNG